jgi:hypothetical protein
METMPRGGEGEDRKKGRTVIAINDKSSAEKKDKCTKSVLQ